MKTVCAVQKFHADARMMACRVQRENRSSLPGSMIAALKPSFQIYSENLIEFTHWML